MPDSGPYAVWIGRDVVEASGEEAAQYLQGQLSQDVLAAGDGASTWTWILTPQGKVEVLARVTRLSRERWLLDTDEGWGEAMVGRLNRFKLRTKVTIEQLDWRVLGLREGAAAEVEGAVGADPAWPGVRGIDLIGAELTAPEGIRVMGPAEYEAERIAVGFPKMGADIDERTIPGETGLVGRTVSFTKGCYTGQELVARIDSRGGNVARRLVRFAADGKVEAGSVLVTPGGENAGVVTSVAETSAGAWVGLGYIKRGVATEEPLAAGAEGVAITVLGPVG